MFKNTFMAEASFAQDVFCKLTSEHEIATAYEVRRWF